MGRYIVEKSNDEIGYWLRNPKTNELGARAYALRENSKYKLYLMLIAPPGSRIPVAKIKRIGRCFTLFSSEIKLKARLETLANSVSF